MFGIAQKLLGSVNDRKIRPYKALVQRINALEPVTEALSDEALKQRTRDFRDLHRRLEFAVDAAWGYHHDWTSPSLTSFLPPAQPKVWPVLLPSLSRTTCPVKSTRLAA